MFPGPVGALHHWLKNYTALAGLGKLYFLVEFHWKGSAINRATPSSSVMITPSLSYSNLPIYTGGQESASVPSGGGPVQDRVQGQGASLPRTTAKLYQVS